MKVGIIGAGPAGVAAAKTIREEDVEVVLFSEEKVPPYYRPRLPEFAFGDDVSDDIFMNRQEWYAENGIELRLDTKVKSYNRDFEVTLEDGGMEKFDALLIATGGGPVIPNFYRDRKAENIFTLWSYDDALKIREKIESSREMVIIGGGVIGVESALRAEAKGLKVTIIERAPHLMVRNFGKKASELIEMQLRNRGIDLLLDDGLTAIERGRDNRQNVCVGSDMTVACDLVIMSIGAGFDVSMAAAAGLETDQRILADKHLQTSSAGIFAAGDIAQLYRLTPCSAKEALQQGRAAGHNILAFLNGKELTGYNVEPVPIRLKYKDFKIYSIGMAPGVKEKKSYKVEEQIFDHDDMKAYRGLIYEDSGLAGVQMVGSDQDINKYQKQFLLAKMWDKIKGTKYGEEA